jgi:hypothetical protein
MKNSKIAKYSIGLWSLVLALLATSCSLTENVDLNEEFAFPEKVSFIKGSPYGNVNSRIVISQPEACGISFKTDLIAGQNINVGEVEVYNDKTTVYITASTTVGSNWYITQSHLKIGSTAASLGIGKNPAPGQFPYKMTHNPALQIVTYEFDIASLPSTFYFAFHAVVVRIDENTGLVLQGETAWGYGPKFVTKGNWATYSGPYTVQECVEDGILEVNDCYGTETGWAGTTAGSGNAWWFYFDTTGPATQMIYAGQKATDGTITYANGLLTINLGSMKLQNVNEPVKIQGYNILPTSRPSAGLFTTYKGNLLTISVAPANYFAIHLDVMVPVACPI